MTTSSPICVVQFQETPALYELKDGKGSLINFDYNAGLYTVPKQLETGYLAIGKKRVWTSTALPPQQGRKTSHDRSESQPARYGSCAA